MTNLLPKPTFYEFFAGAGMVRAGLGPDWRCVFANDFDVKKNATYRNHWGDGALRPGDVREIEVAELPGQADLAWASFPCQDLSLAGGGAGLQGDRSGTFWPFWGLMEALVEAGRAPALIVLENVCGTLTSHGGRDFAAISEAFLAIGYRVGAVVVDAVRFLPQSRARLFLIGVREDVAVPRSLTREGPINVWHPTALLKAQERLSDHARQSWIWWSLPLPRPHGTRFADMVEENPTSVEWHTPAETNALLSMMNELHLAKVDEAKRAGMRMVGTVYKRTRRDAEGNRVQRAEVRFDDVAGCLRTPAGGSSRQLLLVVDGDCVRSRLISSRETARLMGLPESYELPVNYNEAYHLTGDGVVVPVVRHLAEHILEPVASAARPEGVQAVA